MRLKLNAQPINREARRPEITKFNSSFKCGKYNCTIKQTQSGVMSKLASRNNLR